MSEQDGFAARAMERATWAAFYGLKALPSSLCSNAIAGLSAIPRRKFDSTHQDIKRLFATLRPDWGADPALVEAAARRAWDNISRIYAEMPTTHRLVTRGRCTIRDVEILDDLIASGRSFILAFVHTGNWEVSGIQLARRYAPGRRGLAIYDPPRSPALAAIAHHQRVAMPADLVPLSPRVWRQALERLRQPGGVLWMPVDEFAHGKVSTPSFGRPPAIGDNVGKIARLALRTGAVVLPFYGERHPGLEFSTQILPPLTFAGDAADDAAVLAAVQAIDAVVTPPIIRLLDQWYMAFFYRDHAYPA